MHRDRLAYHPSPYVRSWILGVIIVPREPSQSCNRLGAKKNTMPESCILGDSILITESRLNDLWGLICKRLTWLHYPYALSFFFFLQGSQKISACVKVPVTLHLKNPQFQGSNCASWKWSIMVKQLPFLSFKLEGLKVAVTVRSTRWRGQGPSQQAYSILSYSDLDDQQ